MKMIKKGIIVGININNKNNFDESMEELKNLCLACKIETVGQIKQNSKKVNSTFYMGSGKIDELKNQQKKTMQIQLYLIMNYQRHKLKILKKK